MNKQNQFLSSFPNMAGWYPWDRPQEENASHHRNPENSSQKENGGRHRHPGNNTGNDQTQQTPAEDTSQNGTTTTTPLPSYEYTPYSESDAVIKAQQTLLEMQAQRPGEYQSQWQQQLTDLLGQIQNRDKFQYDVNSDALYQQVAQNYMQQGQQAMMDTMGQAAAMTGGYGNSYAQTAGQQIYNQHLLGLAQLVPQYQQMAMQQYQMEGDDLLSRYNLLAQQEDMAYGRYQDDLNRYYAELDRAQAAFDNERDYDYSRFADDRDFDYGKYMDDLNYQYQVDRDAVADSQWEQQWAYQQERDRIQDEQWQMEYDEMVRQFNENLALQQAAAARSGSSGGSGGTPTTDGSTVTYNDVKSTYIDYANSGATTAEKNAILNSAVSNGYITSSEANKIAAIYKTPTDSYTAVDQMWDRHS